MKFFIPAALTAVAVTFIATKVQAQDAVWVGNGTPFGVFVDSTSWSPASVPTGTAIFRNSPSTVIDFVGSTIVGAFQFDPGAPEYNFSGFLSQGSLQFTGAGIVNNSNQTPRITFANPTFYNASTAGNALILADPSAGILFADTSSAVNATIQSFSVVNFFGASRAGNATITNFGNVTFGSFLNPDTASADHATITSMANGSSIDFYDFTTAGNATLISNGHSFVTFRDNSTGGPARRAKNDNIVADFLLTTGPNGDRKISLGSLEGTGKILLGADQLIVGGNNRSTVITGVIADGGLNGGTGASIVKTGTGTLTVAGANTYTGSTTVSAGTLNVTGSIASSSVTVASGASLNGTGAVGATTIQSGGTLAPGNSIGTLTVNGNLTLAAGSIYNVEVSPAAADRTNVSGTASLNGTVAASIASGTFTSGQRFTLINAAGGISGTFALLSVSGLPTYLKSQLSYDGNNAYLTLSPNTLAPLLSGATMNQSKIVAAIDASVATGNVPPGGFVTLYNLSGPALSAALDQISGQVGPNIINAVGQGSLSFLNMTAQGGSNDNFAPGSAYGAADAPHRAQLGAGHMRVWASAYGGHVGLSADAANGAASLSANNVGLIGGVDMAWDEGFLAGVTMGLGQQHFSSGNGTGSSDDIMVGIYARKDAGPLYVAAAFGYGSHHIQTLRVITVSGTDVLQAKQDADDYGGRIEAGWRMALDDQYRLSPYFAVAAENFDTPAYAETALSGASTFALSIAAHSSTLGRTELGSGLSRDYETENGTLTADLRVAWAHQLDDLPLTQASFQSLPSANFLVTGVRPASDAALLGAHVQVQNRSGLFFGVKGETQLGAGTTILEGMGNLGWRW
jgi:outer membrane autotransporter protein